MYYTYYNTYYCIIRIMYIATLIMMPVCASHMVWSSRPLGVGLRCTTMNPGMPCPSHLTIVSSKHNICPDTIACRNLSLSPSGTPRSDAQIQWTVNTGTSIVDYDPHHLQAGAPGAHRNYCPAQGMAPLSQRDDDPPITEAEARDFFSWLCSDDCDRDGLVARADAPHPRRDLHRALVANRLRLQHTLGKLHNSIYEACQHAPWDWDAQPCRCEECKAKSTEASYKCLYTEKLRRRQPWWRGDSTRQDLPLADPPLAAPALACALSSELVDLAVRNWDTVFGPMQEVMRAFPYADGTYRGTRDDGEAASLSFGLTSENLLSMLVSEDEHGHRLSWRNALDKDRLVDESTSRLKRDAYATAAILNALRRSSQPPLNLPGEIEGLRRRKIPFQRLPVLNFEGTHEDNYCLGSREGGRKFYVGVSDDEERRHRQHKGEIAGGAWYPLFLSSQKQGRPPDLFGGWELCETPGQPNRAAAYEQNGAGPFNTDDEEARVHTLAKHQGIHHVRGGPYKLHNLDDAQVNKLRTSLWEHWGCSICGDKGHVSTSCRRRDEQARDDPALRQADGLHASDTRSPDSLWAHYHDVAKAALHNIERVGCRVSRAITICDPVGDDDDDDDGEHTVPSSANDPGGLSQDTATRLQRQLFPLHALRQRQRQAINVAANEDNRNPVILTVPTAYGKTNAYVITAVHEVLAGHKVVIIIPFTALMSDIARKFAGASRATAGVVGHMDTQQSVMVYEADERQQGISAPYAGTMYVTDSDNPGETSVSGQIPAASLVEVTWTIWRGVSGDESMRAHQQSVLFQKADIIITTLDKWVWSNSHAEPDCFLTTFGAAWVAKIGLMVVDEAHEFVGVMGGALRLLIHRMPSLIEACGGCLEQMRVMLVSATIPGGPQLFTHELTGTLQEAHVIATPDAEARFDVEPAEYSPDGGVTAEQISDLVERQKNQGRETHRQRMVLTLTLPLTPHHICTKVLVPDVLRAGENTSLRRVLVFVDSKTTASILMKHLNEVSFKELWREKGVKLHLTPYHGDVARMHRRVAEFQFASAIDEHHLNIIVATSALEAGADVTGVDVVLIVDPTKCSRSSFKQRIGRCARRPNFPALVLVGCDGTDSSDVEATDEDDDARGTSLVIDPVGYLKSVQDTPKVRPSQPALHHVPFHFRPTGHRCCTVAGGTAKSHGPSSRKAIPVWMASCLPTTTHTFSRRHDSL